MNRHMDRYDKRQASINKVEKAGYRIVKELRANQLEAGMMVAAFYDQFNWGVDLMEILGVTGHESDEIEFSSVKECLKFYGARGLKNLVEIIDEKYSNDYGNECDLYVRDLEPNSNGWPNQGPWYYVFDGRWCRGSGAEALSFCLIEKVAGEVTDVPSRYNLAV